MSSSKKRLRSHPTDAPTASAPSTPAQPTPAPAAPSTGERSLKSRKVAAGRKATPAASSPSPAPASPAPLAAAATSTSPALFTSPADNSWDPKHRGYVAYFKWKEHYPKEVSADVPRETAFQPSIPLLFQAILNVIQTVFNQEETGRDVVMELDRKVLKPAATEVGAPPRGEKRVLLKAADGTDYVITACRKEHVRLLYDPIDTGVLGRLGLCPRLLEVYALQPGGTPGAKGQANSLCVGGFPSDPSLPCTCEQAPAAGAASAAAKVRGAPKQRAKLSSSPTASVDDSGDASTSTPTPALAAPAPAAADVDTGFADQLERDQDSDMPLVAGGFEPEPMTDAKADSKLAPAAGRKTDRVRKPLSADFGLDDAGGMDATFSGDESESAAKERDADDLGVADHWLDLENYIAQIRKNVDRCWRAKVREAEKVAEALRTQLQQAEARVTEAEARWKEEKDTNVKLWEKLEAVNRTIDRMVKPLKKADAK